MKRKWLAAFFGFPTASLMIGMLFGRFAFDLIGLGIGIIMALAMGALGIWQLILRNDIIKLDAYNGLLVQLVDSKGIVKIAPASVREGKVYIKGSENPICEFDREKFVFSFVKDNPGKTEYVTSDVLFSIAGKPLLIVDAVVKAPLQKSQLTKYETITMHAISNVVKLSSYLTGKISGIEAVVADMMTKGGIRGLLTKWGMYIAMIIIAIGIAFALVMTVMQGSAPAAAGGIITPRG